MVIVLLPGTSVRFQSMRTRETLLEACRIDDALVVYGSASRDHYHVGLDGNVVRIDGTLSDRVGPAVSFGDDPLRFHTRVLVDVGVLHERYDGSWRGESRG